VSSDMKAMKSALENRHPPPNSGTPWSEAEDRKLVAAFDLGSTELQIAAAHQRTPGAIHARLIKLGKLEPDWKPPAKNAQERRLSYGREGWIE
jgi:hypothetical protein